MAEVVIQSLELVFVLMPQEEGVWLAVVLPAKDYAAESFKKLLSRCIRSDAFNRDKYGYVPYKFMYKVPTSPDRCVMLCIPAFPSDDLEIMEPTLLYGIDIKHDSFRGYGSPVIDYSPKGLTHYYFLAADKVHMIAVGYPANQRVAHYAGLLSDTDPPVLWKRGPSQYVYDLYCVDVDSDSPNARVFKALQNCFRQARPSNDDSDDKNSTVPDNDSTV